MARSRIARFAVALAFGLHGAAGVAAAQPRPDLGVPGAHEETEGRIRCAATDMGRGQFLVRVSADEQQRLEDELDASCVPRALWPWH